MGFLLRAFLCVCEDNASVCLWSVVCLSVCLSVRWGSISSQVLEPIGMKLGRMIKGMHENVTKKEFFGSVDVDRGQASGPQVPLLGRGDDKETQNWT